MGAFVYWSGCLLKISIQGAYILEGSLIANSLPPPPHASVFWDICFCITPELLPNYS